MRRSEVSLALVALGSVTMTAWLWNELRVERARYAELGARAASLPASGVAEDPASPAPAESPAVATPATPAVTPQTTTTVSSNNELYGAQDAEAALRRMLQQAPYREAWRAQQRLNYARRRENVIRLLGFTPEEADAIVEVAIDRQLTWYDRGPSNSLAKGDTGQAQALFEQDQREDEAKFRALLGEEKYARFQQYMESRSTRIKVDELRPQFTGADALRDDQVEPLIAALHVERTRLNTEQQEYRKSIEPSAPPSVDRYSDGELALLKAAYERMHSAAAPVLSGSQLKRLDALLKRDLERQELEARMLSGSPDAETANAD